MLRKYLKGFKTIIILLAGISLIFAVTFFLFGLPFEAVAYPIILSVVFTIVVVVCGAIGEKKKEDILEEAAKRGAYLDTEVLPDDTPVEEAYRRVVELLLEERADNITESNAKYQDLSQYYTLWAHQIKTPIASMRLKLTGEDSRLSRELSSDLFRIEQYVDMVMTYVRLGSDSTDYTFKKCSLDSLIRSSVKKFSSDFIRKKLSLEFEPQGISVLTDEKWLGFVLEQLLSNALKYTQKGSIRIRTGEMDASSSETGDRRYFLEVSDTGIGISPENLPRIFEIGFTGVNGRMEDNRASGIGLYLVSRICKNLGIEISAESVVGEGTTIRLMFSGKETSLLQN